MQTLAQIKSILESCGLRPQKFLGQNFLIDHNLIRKLVDAAGLEPGGVVLEIGPGTGTMTEELLERGSRVIACELDRGLASMLRDRFKGHELFILVEGDCLESKRALNPAVMEAIERAGGGRGFKLVSNLPYGAATPVMTVLLTRHPACSTQCVTIQREVADRMLATPGSKDYGPVSVIAQALADVQMVGKLPPECFWPRPDVTSAMIAIRRRAVPLCADPEGLAEFATELFTQRRKQLGSVLARMGWKGSLPEGVTGQMRAEELTVAQVVAMAGPGADRS
jgi:16S rRNA (adenine1518-N6/adenine1519-N6)-dimethyltransferase